MLFGVRIELPHLVAVQRLQDLDARLEHPGNAALRRMGQHLRRGRDRRHIEFRFGDGVGEVGNRLA
jgi:hypothetical protein